MLIDVPTPPKLFNCCDTYCYSIADTWTTRRPSSREEKHCIDLRSFCLSRCKFDSVVLT